MAKVRRRRVNYPRYTLRAVKKKKVSKAMAADWATKWIDAVAAGESTMSQRKLSSIETRGGGLAAIRRCARQRGVHLLQLTDDRGNELIAASTQSFKVIC